MGRRHRGSCCRGNNHNGCGNNVSPDYDEVIVNPTETVVNTTTNRRRVKNIHPINVVNVNRTIVRNDNFYPVTESEVNQTVVEEYDCGSNPSNPNNCRRRRNNGSNGFPGMFN